MYTDKTYISPNKFISYDTLFANINHKNEIAFYDHSAYNFLENKFKSGELDIKDKRVLDVGSNIGSYCFLSEKYGAIVTGVDFNTELYNISNIIKEKIKSNVEFLNININKIDITNKYDIVYLFNDPILIKDSVNITIRFLLQLLKSNIEYVYIIHDEEITDRYLAENIAISYDIINREYIGDDLYFLMYKKKEM